MDDYNDIRNLLKPRRYIKASETFRKTIENDIRGRADTSDGWRFVWGSLTLGAAVAILILLFVPSGMSAKELLAEAISAIKKSSHIAMKVDIRTDSREIFEHINPNAEFETHDIMLQRHDSTTYWYVGKGERAAEKNNDGLYVWITPLNIGWHYIKEDRNVLGYLNLLINPENVLESELEYTLSAPEAICDITEREGEIILTIHSMPKGSYANPYALNTSIEESENIRRYILDAQNHHLKSSTVSMVVDGKEIEVLKVTDIDYDPENRNLPSPPADITFIKDSETTSPSGIPGLDARETASVFLNALYEWDTDILYRFLNPIQAEKSYRQTYEGARLLTLGEPFRSGSNPHLIFVPYTLLLRGGHIKKMNLVLTGCFEDAWRFDGGL